MLDRTLCRGDHTEIIQRAIAILEFYSENNSERLEI